MPQRKFFLESALTDMLKPSECLTNARRSHLFLDLLLMFFAGTRENPNGSSNSHFMLGLAGFIFRHSVASFWTEETLFELDEKFKDFKTKAKKIFENYHASTGGKQKWRMQEYISGSMQEAGGFENLQTETFENAQQTFERY